MGGAVGRASGLATSGVAEAERVSALVASRWGYACSHASVRPQSAVACAGGAASARMCERGDEEEEEEKRRRCRRRVSSPKESSSQLELDRVDSAYGSSSLTEALLESSPRGQEEGEGQQLEALTYLSQEGDTFLHLAIIHGCPEIAVDFISLVTTEVLEIQNDSYQSPLHLAVYLDQAEVVKALVQKGVNVELQDQNGDTPLHIACEWDHLHCAQILLQEDEPENSFLIQQNLQLQNWKGLACLHIATLKQSCALISLLLRRGADINVQLLDLLHFDDLKISGKPVVWSERRRRNRYDPKRGND
uniref:NF-kappa-B inhibitor epsilon isoform X2 n=1 Tax=Geotrypetes seraphini TaxID=260995 RepID=A0A6P8QDD5_GEOSA|nr:NF-kappa-B inhibitor epsilon isoform X2 [Geotrypetes seraphini]